MTISAFLLQIMLIIYNIRVQLHIVHPAVSPQVVIGYHADIDYRSIEKDD